MNFKHVQETGMADTGWYYVDRDRRIGPLERAEMERLVGTGEITGNTLVWREGMDGWETASGFFATGMATSPPPMPQSSFQSQQTVAAHAGGDIGADGLYVGAPSRTFGEAIKICFNKFVDFQGRASRSEYWFFVLFGFLVNAGASILDVAIVGPMATIQPLSTIVSLVLLLPQLAVSVRRLHDIDRTGWWIFGGMIVGILFGVIVGAAVAAWSSYGAPDEGTVLLLAVFGLGFLAYLIVLLVFYCTKGTPGPNRFG